MENLTASGISSIAGIVMSLLFELIPPLKRWFEDNVGEYKFLFMAVVLLIVTAGILAYECSFDPVCMRTNLPSALLAFIASMLANQGTYKAIVKPRQITKG